MKKIIVVVLVLCLCVEFAKADFIWTQKADMPTGRWTQTSAAVNGKIYVIGGRSSQPDEKTLSTVEEYDPVTNIWTRKADMSTVRCDMIGSSAVVDGKIYVIGGYNGGSSWGSSTVEEYDPVTDTWTRKTDIPTPRWSLATCAVDGKIYAIGGAPDTPDSITGLNIVEQYDPTTDTWTRKANMPTGVWGLCACVVNGKIYALGGRPGYTAIPNVQEYDPATDTWTRKTDMPVGTSQMASGVLDDKIIVIGGWISSGNPPYTIVQIYDPKTDTWTREADTPFLRAAVAGEVVNDKIYVIGGTDRPHPCPALSTVYECGPLVDFNWDGIVDGEDVSIMIDNWHTDSPLCDIAPFPLGDGFVDVRDLTILAEHLFEEVFRMELVAYWKLDEEGGDIAYNSIGDNHGILSGNPIWRPGSGQIVGAMEFDGIDDYISTDFVLDPSWGAFSVFAWVKGNAPGQTIISQLDGIGTGQIWFGLDAQSGNLMSGLVPPPLGRTKPEPLISESIITDDQWHHVGFVCDGSYRFLYVDGVEVAKDTRALPQALMYSNGGLYIGADKTLGAGTFFSGLIDDVRIYDVALTSEEIAALAQ